MLQVILKFEPIALQTSMLTYIMLQVILKFKPLALQTSMLTIYHAAGHIENDCSSQTMYAYHTAGHTEVRANSFKQAAL